VRFVGLKCKNEIEGREEMLRGCLFVENYLGMILEADTALFLI